MAIFLPTTGYSVGDGADLPIVMHFACTILLSCGTNPMPNMMPSVVANKPIASRPRNKNILSWIYIVD